MTENFHSFLPKMNQQQSVHPLSAGRGGGLDRTSNFGGGGAGKRGRLFQEGCNCHIKNKLKSEILNDKNKVYK